MIHKIGKINFNNLTKEEIAEIKVNLEEEGFNKEFIEAYDNYKSPWGIALNPKDSSDRLLHYNLERLREDKDIKVNTERLKYSKKNKFRGKSKYIMPFEDIIILGTDIAATLGMGFPIPRIFEEYIMNADQIQITGEDSDAAKSASSMTVKSKRIYLGDIGIDHSCCDGQIKVGVNDIADTLISGYDGENWQCEDIHLMTAKQMAKALMMDIPVLTTQMYNKIYEGSHTACEDIILPHYYDVMEYMWDTPKHNSIEHMEQIERVLLKLESAGNVFYGMRREQDFPLLVEDHISIEEYNKRDLEYILNN